MTGLCRRLLHPALLALAGLSAASAWSQETVRIDSRWGRFVQAADASEQNQALTNAHLVAVKGSHFVAAGADWRHGTPDDVRVRFFGVNLAAEAAFPDPGRAREVAATLRSLGFNAVRLHHLESYPSADPQVFRSTLTTGPYPSFHAGAIERLRAFVAALKQEGIYVNLNLNVGYPFRVQADQVPAPDAATATLTPVPPGHVFHPRLIELQTRYAQELLRQLNLGSDPVLAQVEITNESSLAAHWLYWDKTRWDRLVRGPYRSELQTQWEQWLKQRHGSLQAACQAWGGCNTPVPELLSPLEGESLGHTGSASVLERLRRKADDAWWQASQAMGFQRKAPGENTEVSPRLADFLRFLADVDKRFFNRMRHAVHQATRSNLPVTGTQMGYGAPLNFLSHADMDYVDDHFYVDHYEFPATPWAPDNWFIGNTALSSGELPRLLSLGYGRDLRRPFVVSEFSQAFPNRHGSEMVPVMAAVASAQDWDGLYLFDYVDGNPLQHTPHNFNLQGDWLRTVFVAGASRLFRQAWLPPLEKTESIAFHESQVLGAIALRRRPDTWSLYQTREQRQNPLDLLHTRKGLGPERPLPPQASAEPAPSTHGLRHLPGEKQILLSTLHASGVFGEVPPDVWVHAGDLSVRNSKGHATPHLAVMLHSADGKPLRESARMLLSAPGVVSGTLAGAVPPRPQKLVPHPQGGGKWTLEPPAGASGGPSGPRHAEGPLWMERNRWRVVLRNIHPEIAVYALSSRGERLAELPPSSVRKLAEGHEILLNETPQTTALWFELVKTARRP
jgi:hypothetical protein